MICASNLSDMEILDEHEVSALFNHARDSLLREKQWEEDFGIGTFPSSASEMVNQLKKTFAEYLQAEVNRLT